MKYIPSFAAAVAFLLTTSSAFAQSDDMTFLYEEPVDPPPYFNNWSVYISGDEQFELDNPANWSALTLYREGKSADFRAELTVNCNSDGDVVFGSGLLYGTDELSAEEVEEMIPFEVLYRAYDWRCLL